MSNIWDSSTKNEKVWYDKPSTKIPQVDLRERFNELIKGVLDYEGLGQFLILRKFNHDQRTPGYDKLRGGSTDDPWDQGEPFTWTEEFVFGHFTQTFGRALMANNELYQLRPEGIYNQDKAIAYLMYDAGPKTGDELFRVRVNADGSTYYPVEIKEKWRIVHVEDRRQEHQKIAFYICICERMQM